MTPRPMTADDESGVREIYRLCNPGATPRPPFWYFVHPTLVIESGNMLVGFTSFTVTVIPGFGETLYGMGIAVHPDYRGQALGEILHTERLRLGHANGVRIFMGVTSGENKSMIKIFEKSGMHPCIPVGKDVLFVGPIGA